MCRAQGSNNFHQHKFIYSLIFSIYIFKIFTLVGKNVDPIVFYNVQRPLLAGFYPEKLMLEGTEEIEKPLHWISSPKGPSAGQSTIFVMLDKFLGINHGEVANEFQEEMINYMPRQHKHIVLRFKEKLNVSLRHFITGNYVLLIKISIFIPLA